MTARVDLLFARWAAARILGIACALVSACASDAAKPPVSAEWRGETPSEPYLISVSRPTGGTLTSVDGQIECGTAGSGVDACGPVRYESSVTFTAEPDPGFKFVGWLADCGGTAPTCIVATSNSRADKWVAAAFKPEAEFRGTYFSVTVTRPDGGSVKSHDNQIACGVTERCGPAVYPWNEEARLEAIPNRGFKFRGWGGDCSGKRKCTLTTKSSATDKSVTATFEPE